MAQDTTYTSPATPPGATTPPPRTTVADRTVAETRFDAESTPGLLRRLADDLSTLLRKEVALATSEVSRAMQNAREGAMSVAAGGAVLFSGFIFLLLSATYGLAEVMEPWLAALIVGGVVAIIGYAMLSSGRKKLEASNFKPERTQESLREDKEMLQRRAR